jgi:hypothetical protein
MTWAKRIGLVVLVVALGFGAVQGWHGVKWLVNEISPNPIWFGEAARERAVRVMGKPLPEGAVVVAISRGGFQDPYVQLRIDAPRALQGQMLAFLGITEEDLRPGPGRSGFSNHPQWFGIPRTTADWNGVLPPRNFHGIDLRLVPGDHAGGNDIYLINAWTM